MNEELFGLEDLIPKKKRPSGAIELPGDYEKGGLLFCGRCGQPKEFNWAFRGKDKIVKAICRCEQEKLAAEEEKKKEIERRKAIELARYAGFPDSDYRSFTFDTDDRKNAPLSAALKRYCDKFEDLKAKGQGLLLYGPVASGKTFMACCVANALIDRGYTCLATNFSRIHATLWETDRKQAYMDSLNKYDLLILDDLGIERESQYMQEIVFNVIDNRDRAGLPMIITTNMDAEELGNAQEIGKQRIYSRILKRCYPIKVEGNKRRVQHAIANNLYMKELIGL